MELPVIDLEPYLDVVSGKYCGDEALDPQLKTVCSEVSRTLRETGALLIKDPRCSAQDNDRFIDMMEKYFEQPDDVKRLQERPHLHYQVGVTPEGVEVPRSLVDGEMQKKLQSLPEESRPLIPTGPDPKWRYMWRVGPRPSTTRFQELNSEPVIPEGFPEWKETMDSWGSKMIAAIEAVAEMAAIGFGLPKDAFTGLMKQGPHLLAPTGSDLRRHGKEGTVFAGYHYDLNFLTIHGRSRFPGLSIWLRNGKKVEVKVPVGCLLIQTGKQIEWLTAGDCIAGMHEVVVTNRTLDAIKAASQENRSLWRVSSTLFAHIASDAVLKPLGHFAQAPLADKYPPICTGEFVEQELSLIPCRASVAPFSPIPPNEACCNALRVLGQPCLCVLVNGPPISGVDRSMAMQLPEKCNVNFGPCELKKEKERT
ncbi:hypothetical protein OSB04_013028 [Centaurea solstitialis]|uniref:Bifunctional inhibitor/plant lipid transfer protein/seed storage helical domain-containing protein n=1 Tax=Centaurea solstitialis TaxID=347529 RepID=A0AA38TE79_9ASTR|nr:hypothetical protein OSB04_013028 [Centaurea solstitialis]